MYIRSIRSSVVGNCHFLQERKNDTSPGVCPGGMVTSKIEPCIIRRRKTTYVSADGWMVNFTKYWVASLQWIFLKTCVLFAPLRWTETYTAPCEYGPAPALYSVVHAPCASVRITRVIGPQSSGLHRAQKNMAVAATYSINVLITFCCCFRPLLGDDIQKGLFVRLLFFWNWPI